ncbi:uncharacterized protein BT62DRAFT_1071639 [Guyanagaster necrorhizus]|uniref:Uncharacterized protein n=1 Tax=Guyanagaster necrorhizus TaxID=856835 RepID=A0A9P8AWU0_9AGAR|nr:uncharacterized protein BT62DRAFT_1071639 [Guyanagaster necrorhizus MCA 3950]KAG7451039.1 hypothetical protein BT62DRAFT_1071639 [Guyanagaster necrorhizus MCA 3950]
MAVKEDVKKFNGLPRRPRMPSGNFLNEWHFDLRFVHCLQPPLHILFLRISRLTRTRHVSNGSMETYHRRPEFLKLGILIMHSFLVTFEGINHSFCGPGSPSSTVLPPFPIGYKALDPLPLIPDSVLRLVNQDTTALEQGKIIAYAQLRIGCRPCDASKYLGSSAADEEMKTTIASVDDLLKSQPMNVVKTKANGGDAEGALDYGLRLVLLVVISCDRMCSTIRSGLTHGCGCSPNRSLTRQYLMMAAYSSKGSDITKATAHDVLVEWYSVPSPMPQRYLCAATWHANEIVKLFLKRPSPMAFKFAFYVIEPQLNTIPDLAYPCQELLGVMKRRTAEVEKSQS